MLQQVARKLLRQQLRHGIYVPCRSLISQSLRDQDPEDEGLLERKKLKTVEHYLPEKPASGQVQYPDQIEFYKKVVVSSSSQGYRAVRMSKEISSIRQSYVANTDYTAHEIVQLCGE